MGVLGILLHLTLIATVGMSNIWVDCLSLAAQVVLTGGAALLRGHLPRPLWGVYLLVVTPAVAVLVPAYGVPMLVVLPVLFVLVLFSSLLMSRVLARVIAVMSLVVAAMALVQTHEGEAWIAVEMVSVLCTLLVCHLLLVLAADAEHALVAKLEETARTDGLTGLLNRRAFDRALDGRLRRAGPTSLLLIDVDHFKSINDTYGHAVGDAAIRHIGAVLTDGLRDVDTVISRLGGDELAILLPDCPPDVASARAEQLVSVVAGAPLVLPGGAPLGLSVSVGVATASGSAGSGLYTAADTSLYAAKKAGRGRVGHLDGVPDPAAATSARRPDVDGRATESREHVEHAGSDLVLLRGGERTEIRG